MICCFAKIVFRFWPKSMDYIKALWSDFFVHSTLEGAMELKLVLFCSF